MDNSNGSSGAVFVVMRLVHFVGGTVASMPISFHKTGAEAEAAKHIELERLRNRFKVHGAKQLLELIGIGAIHLEIGEFRTSHEDLIKVPRLIVTPGAH